MSESDKLLRHNFYVFPVNGKLFGIDIGAIREVKEINDANEITPLPHSQPSVLGYVNVRGSVQQVISLDRLLDDSTANASDGGMIIYCKGEATPDTGIYSDHPGEIVPVEEKEIDRWEAPPSEDLPTNKAKTSYMACGAFRIPKGMVTLLSPERIYRISSESL